MTENWHTWYLGGADSKSRLRFLKFQPQNPFVGIFGPKIQNCPFCPDLDFWNLDPKIHFLCKFGPKNSKLSILSENWYTWYLKDADSYSNISFLNFKSLFPFWANLGQKKSKLSVLTENWHTWYLRSAYSESGLRCLKFWLHNSFLCKFGLKKSKLSVFPEDWHA